MPVGLELHQTDSTNFCGLGHAKPDVWCPKELVCKGLSPEVGCRLWILGFHCLRIASDFMQDYTVNFGDRLEVGRNFAC